MKRKPRMYQAPPPPPEEPAIPVRPPPPGYAVGQPCPRCRRIATAQHWYNRHTRQGRQRYLRYELSEKGRNRKMRYRDKVAREKLQELIDRRLVRR